MQQQENDLFGRCPYYTSQHILGGKWALLILHYLYTKTMRFKELERALAPITQATLTKQLRALEEHGLITRVVYSQIPPKVEYSLSELGEKFKPVLDTLEEWSKGYLEYLHSK